MVSLKRGIRAEEVRLQGQHVLFVEGKDRSSVDPKILGELFGTDTIKIEPLGPSYSIKSVAQALYSYHPTYYFLIDRDHHDDDFVAQCWNHFPDPDKYNLLVWKRREIENYFLDPNYLFQSKYREVSQEEIEKTVLECAKDRLFLDTANHVVISVREELKRNWIGKFSNPLDFPSKEDALTKLKSAIEFEEHKMDVSQKVSSEEIEKRFEQALEKMTGGFDTLTIGQGKWMEMVQGKKVLSLIINSGCFKVEASDGSILNGKEKLHAVIKDLLKKDADVQPDDFLELKDLINLRINGPN